MKTRMKKGTDVIRDKMLYKSTVFSRKERDRLGLRGLENRKRGI
jgi:hypothetical protein